MATAKAPAVHLQLPGGDEAGPALNALHPQPLIALNRVVGLDLLDHRRHPLHHGGKIGPGLAGAEAEFASLALFKGEAGASDQRLGGDAAGVEAISPHLVLLDQGHPGLDRGGYVAGDQAPGTGAYHQQVVVEASRFAIGGVQPAQGEPALQPAHQPGHQAEQGQGRHQTGGEDLARAGEGGEFAARQHIDEGARQHAELADPVVGTDSDGGEPHQQVDQKEGEEGDEAQAQQIEGAILRHAGLKGGQLVPKAAAHPVAQQEAGAEKGQGGPKRAGERDQQ